MPSIAPVLRRPRILVLGALILALATAFVSLGFWQLRRLDERKRFNETLLSRTSEAVVPFEDLPSDPSVVPYRRITAVGTYETDDEILLVGRSRNTLAGHELVTPLRLDDGSILLVDRGWVPLDVDDPPVDLAAPPEGTLEVTGVLFPSQERGRFGPRHASTGVLTRMHRIEIARIAQQLDGIVHPWYLLLESQQPPTEGTYPQSLVLPALGEGPHRSYALQWFAFALIGLATYAAVLIKESKRVASDNRIDSDNVA